MKISRRWLLLSAAALLTACAQAPSLEPYPPVVFVHGNGDSASIWQTAIWRFESNGWPRDRLYAIDMPLPFARDDDTKPQAGRSSAGEHAAFLKSEVDKVLRSTGARQVVLAGNSRGGNAIRNYIENAGGMPVVSHAILGGTPNHGVWSVHIDGLQDTSEFAGHGPMLSALNRPKNANGDEVTGPVRWMTVRSDSNDKYAQPDGFALGRPGVATGVTVAGPALKGATNVVIPRIDHRETSTSPQAFEAGYRFITGQAPARLDIAPEAQVTLSGHIHGAGTNLGLGGARVRVFAVDAGTGERQGDPAYASTTGSDGAWGPFNPRHGTFYEFEVEATGYATTHFYRSPFPRSSVYVNMRPERVRDSDKGATALAIMTRPRGYLDATRDKISFDGQSPPPGTVPSAGPGAAFSVSRLTPQGPPRPIVAEFNGERVVGRLWPLSQNHVSVLEMTY